MDLTCQRAVTTKVPCLLCLFNWCFPETEGKSFFFFDMITPISYVPGSHLLHTLPAKPNKDSKGAWVPVRGLTGCLWPGHWGPAVQPTRASVSSRPPGDWRSSPVRAGSRELCGRHPLSPHAALVAQFRPRPPQVPGASFPQACVPGLTWPLGSLFLLWLLLGKLTSSCRLLILTSVGLDVE